jgi:hypothetical protein
MAIIQDVYQLETAQFQAQIQKVQADYNATAKGADKAGAEGKKFGSETAKGAKQATEGLKSTEKQTGVLGGALKKLSVAVAAAFATKKIIDFAKASVEAANVQLQAEAKLRQALQGREDMFERLTARASELQKVTVIGDEAIIAQQSFLAAQGRTEEQINNTIDAAIQLAAVTDTDLATAVQTLDKTLEGNAGRLGNLDERFKGLTAEQLKNGAAIDLVNEKYKGFAETQATTGTGALKQLQNSFGDLQEEIGKQLIPIISSASNALNGFINFIIDNQAVSKAFDFIRSIWQPIFDSIQKTIGNLQRVFKAFNSEGESSIDWIKVFGKTVEISMLPLKGAVFVAEQFSTALASVVEWISETIASLRNAVPAVDRFFTTMGKLGSYIGSKFGKDTEQGVDQLQKLRGALEGLTDAEKIARLEKWREALKDNEQAVKVIDAEIDKLKLNLANMGSDEPIIDPEELKKRLAERLQAEQEFQKQREQIGREIEDLHISLIADEQQREDTARQTRYTRMIQDLQREQDITAAEKDAMRALILQKQEEENKAVAEARAKAAEQQAEKDKADITRQELEKIKLRADLFAQYFQPTMEELQKQELEALEKAYQEDLVTFEEYERLKAAVAKKYSEEGVKAEITLREGLLKSQELFSSAISDILSVIGNESSEFADFAKALAIFDVAMKTAVSISNAIAGATAAAAATGAGAPFVLAGYIASMIGTVVAGFSQVSGILAAEPPRYFEGTASVPLAGNKAGRDTIPAMLNQGEAVIPTDDNRAYPGLAEAWIGGDLDRYIHKNWVAPQLREKERERAERELNAIGQMMAQGFDDYRLHKDNREMIGVMRSGFDRLGKNRLGGYRWGSK